MTEAVVLNDPSADKDVPVEESPVPSYDTVIANEVTETGFDKFSIKPEDNSYTFDLISPSRETLILGSGSGADVTRTKFSNVEIHIGNSLGNETTVVNLKILGNYTSFSHLKLVDIQGENRFSVVGSLLDRNDSSVRLGFASVFDHEGKLIWHNAFKSSLEAEVSVADIVISEIFLQENGDYVVFGDEVVPYGFGRQEKSRIFFSRLTRQGEVLTSRSSRIYQFDNATAVIPIENDQFFVLSETRASIDQYERLRAILFDDEGKIISHIRYPAERLVNVKDALRTSDGSIYVFGSHYINDKSIPTVWNFSPDGTILEVDTIDFDFEFSEVFQKGGGFLFTANKDCDVNRPCASVYELSRDLQYRQVWNLPPNKNYDRQWLRASVTTGASLLLAIDDFKFSGSEVNPRLHEVLLK